MSYIKISSINHKFCCGIMLFALIVFPFFLVNAQDSAEPDTQATSKPQNNQTQSDTESDTQDTSKPQNNQTQSDTESDTQGPE